MHFNFEFRRLCAILSLLRVEETLVPSENHSLTASHWQLSHSPGRDSKLGSEKRQRAVRGNASDLSAIRVDSTCTFMRTRIHTHTHINTHILTIVCRMQAYIHTYKHTFLHTYIQIFLHTNIHTCMYMYRHAYSCRHQLNSIHY